MHIYVCVCILCVDCKPRENRETSDLIAKFANLLILAPIAVIT